MILTPFVRMQLRVFTLASLVGAVVLGVWFLRIPEAVGIGRYTVTANFDRGAGLYEGAQVNFLGTPVGKVTDMRIAEHGIEVELNLVDDVRIPAGVIAEVHSLSAVGEQYVELVPTAATENTLAEGDRIPIERTDVPVEIGPVLDNVGKLVDSLPPRDLDVLLDETRTALTGRTRDIQAVLDGTSRVVGLAQENIVTTKRLLRDAEPVLGSLSRSATDIATWTRSLAALSATLKEGDRDFRALLRDAGPWATSTNALLTDVEPELVAFLDSGVEIATLFASYNGNLASLLTTFPKLAAVVQSIAGVSPGRLSLTMVSLNNPNSCVQGFVPRSQWRDPEDLTVVDTPLVYCDVSPSNPRAVRGARNYPCEANPARRAATPALCRRHR